jgi:hypothetical protein
MKFTFTIILISILFLSGCSQTYLHIVNQGYSEQKINALKVKLNKYPIKVFDSSIPIPKAFPASTIATNPNFSDLKLLNSIESELLSLNTNNLTHLTFAQGKHFYSVNHIGLYLRNDDNIKPVMPAYLRTQYCRYADATIMFKGDGRFAVEFEKDAYEDELVIVNGAYTFDGTNLQMITDDNVTQSYIFSKEMKETQFGERPADVYKPKSTLSAIEALNCEFLIIYME